MAGPALETLILSVFEDFSAQKKGRKLVNNGFNESYTIAFVL